MHEAVGDCVSVYWSIVFLCNLDSEAPTGTHVNFDGNFSQHEYQIHFQPFTGSVSNSFLFRGIELFSMAAWRLVSLVGLFCTIESVSSPGCWTFVCLVLPSGLGQWHDAKLWGLAGVSRLRHHHSLSMCVCACVWALSGHTAGSPSPNLFTQVLRVVSVCVCFLSPQSASVVAPKH